MREIKFFVPGPLPSFNEIVEAAKTPIPWLCKGKRKVFEYTKMKKEWTEKVSTIIHLTLKTKIRMYDRVNVSFLWVCTDKRTDPDNTAAGKKFILDGIMKAGLIKEDNANHILGLSDAFLYAKASNPGCYVVVRCGNGE